MKTVNRNAISKLIESSVSILPIAAVILIAAIFIVPVSGYDIGKFVMGTVFLVVGMFLFSIGADSATLPIGQNIGGTLSKSRNLTIFILCSLILGFVMTAVEPDIAILAGQVLQVNKWIFIAMIALGSGIFTMLAVLRIIFGLRISTILFIIYSLIIVLMFFVPSQFVPLAFDASAVTTGPISTPFLLSFGLGISAVRSNKDAQSDSFGFIALASAGPIITIMLLGLFAPGSESASVDVATLSQSGTTASFFLETGREILNNLRDVGIVILALTLIFLIFNFFMMKLPKFKTIKILIGILFTYVGITLFLTGVNLGYLPIGSILGFHLASESMYWVLFPFCILIGFCIIFAEPAVHVLVKKVKEVTNNIISSKTMFISLACGITISLLLSLLRVLLNIDFLYIILPCYVLILILTFFTPQMFSAIAFDSGGVATGTMAVGFLLPLIKGICIATGTDIAFGAFGTAALVSAMPLLSLQILGISYRIISHKKEMKLKPYLKTIKKSRIEIIEFGE